MCADDDKYSACDVCAINLSFWVSDLKSYLSEAFHSMKMMFASQSDSTQEEAVELEKTPTAASYDKPEGIQYEMT